MAPTTLSGHPEQTHNAHGALRRYRAERLLRRDFHALRERVLAGVRANLGARRIVLDTADLEECYAQAWQGLYTALLEGQQIDNPAGWLARVCFRRAIDEYRTRRPEQRGIDGDPSVLQGHVEPDLAGELDDRVKLRQTFEGLRQRLTKREQQAASLCYLQGLSRAQAAARMGISEARMRKLMEGRGPERPGVAAKMDALLETVAGGAWCEQQASLMRGLAYGIQDPAGERYRLAQLHQRECPACRAYVISLRGLAAVLPPLLLPLGPAGMAGLGGALGGGASAGASGAGASGAGAGASGAGAGMGAGGSGAGVGAPAGAGVGAPAGAGAGAGAGTAASGSAAAGLGGAAGGGATAGGWLPLGSSLGVKLATGCVLALSVGGGCVALVTGLPRHSSPTHASHRQPLHRGPAVGLSLAPGATEAAVDSSDRHTSLTTSARGIAHARSPQPTDIAAAQRELGFERPPQTASRAPRSVQAAPATAHYARQPSSPSQTTSAPHTATAPERGAESEFGIG